jgi:ATP-binding protein involved in chromosome partitioning
MLGSLPLDINIREDADNGQPTVVKNPEGDIAMAYRVIARRIAANLAKQSKNYAAAFPNIVIKND